MTNSGNHTRNKLEALLDLFEGLALNKPGKELYLKHKWAIDEARPTDVYQIKENLLFPILEKHWNNFRCVQVMWSIHDDIRRNLKELIDLLGISIANDGLPEENNLNTLLGDLFFAMYAIKFRGRKIQISYYALRNEQKEYMGVL